MAGGQRAPGTQGGALGTGPDQNTTDESTRTPSMKRGPQPTGTTPEPPRPQAPNPPTPEQGSHSNTTSGPATTRKGNPVRRKPSHLPLTRVMLARPPPLASLMVHQTMVRGPPGREAVADDPGIHPLNGNKLDEGQGRIARPTKVKASTVASPASLADPRGIPNQRRSQG